ncbi:TIR domain-containing protein [Blastococcus sp. SYSU DS0619]
MPGLRTYNLFISHAWDYSDAYEQAVGLLSGSSYFSWKNYSAPTARPAVPAGRRATKAELTQELKDQIRGTHAVIVIAGMYVAQSDWIQTEIDIASGWGKPVIGLKPRGANRTPVAVSDAAVELVGWTTASLVAAVRRHALSAA